uniref:Uncharacterized protein n=1 Tax=Meloidogyne enterolobii TaxID=390850 RepID=A0A6V7WA99_MELEN|nr:unnamed protein product [Meloidogyne enterolobii]
MATTKLFYSNYLKDLILLIFVFQIICFKCPIYLAKIYLSKIILKSKNVGDILFI